MDSPKKLLQKDKLSLGLSVAIALCLILTFFAISIAIADNVSEFTKDSSGNSLVLPSPIMGGYVSVS